MNNPSLNDNKIHNLIEQRWSPRAFDSEMVEAEKIGSILEAARWSPSAFNEQPWRFMVGQKGDATYDNILSSLDEWNQLWAGKAPLLILNIAKKTFTHNGKPNVTFKYDLGQSMGAMILEIVNQGLVSHQMSGFNPSVASELLSIPDDYQPVSIIAVGYMGSIDDLPEEIAKIETKPRERKKLSDLVFAGKFGNSMEL